MLEGSCYHVLARGNNRSAIFHSDADFQRYCQLLATHFPEQQVRLYHYCLMPNHVHLVVELGRADGLRKAMQRLNLCYALTYNRRYEHSGHLWQDRFKSLLIDKDSYLLRCGAYIELNPVRAKLVPTPESYPWSSYRYYAHGHPDALITANPLYAGFGGTSSERQIRYRRFVLDQVEPLADQWVSQRVMGSPAFLQELEARFGHPVRSRPAGRPRRPATKQSQSIKTRTVPGFAEAAENQGRF